MRIAILPDETDAPLVIDANAVPPGPLALVGLQMVRGRRPHVIQSFRLVKSDQFSQGRSLDIRRQFPGRTALPDPLGFFAAERLNHFRTTITRRVILSSRHRKICETCGRTASCSSWL